MRVRAVSDLHFEFHRDQGKECVSMVCSGEWDLMVCAGDICSLSGLERALEALARAAGGRPVAYVTGNHDAYGGTVNAAQQSTLSAARRFPNLHVLDRYKVLEICGKRVLGCTLWFRWPGPSIYDRAMCDFSAIRGLGDHVDHEADRCAEFLRRNVSPGDVVVTHHMPHPGSVHPRHAGSVLNRYFLHDLSDVVEDAEAALWVHGHTHSSMDYIAGSTRVLCNPLGYAVSGGCDEPNPDFTPDLTVET